MEGKGPGYDYDAWWNDHWDSLSIDEKHEWRTFLPPGNPFTDPPIPYNFSKLFSPNTRSIAFGMSQENMPSHHSISVWYGKSGAMFCVLKRKCHSKGGIQVRIVGLIQGGIKVESKNKAVMFTPDQVQWICAIANKDQAPEALSDKERFKLKPEKESAWALLGQVLRSRATKNSD